jgi:hypothetical protein
MRWIVILTVAILASFESVAKQVIKDRLGIEVP